MAGIEVYNLEGKAIGSVPVPKSWEGPVEDGILWQAVRMYLANRRQGTADTKTRGEVRGGGKKPWRQKHTGRARAGSIRSPLWRKGGIVFGPHPREYRYSLPKAIRRGALVNSLKEKVGQKAVTVVEGFDGVEPKTRALCSFLRRIHAEEGALLVVGRPSAPLTRASRNLNRVGVCPAADLNCFDILASRRLVITREALQQLGGAG